MLPPQAVAQGPLLAELARPDCPPASGAWRALCQQQRRVGAPHHIGQSGHAGGVNPGAAAPQVVAPDPRLVNSSGSAASSRSGAASMTCAVRRHDTLALLQTAAKAAYLGGGFTAAARLLQLAAAAAVGAAAAAVNADVDVDVDVDADVDADADADADVDVDVAATDTSGNKGGHGGVRAANAPPPCLLHSSAMHPQQCLPPCSDIRLLTRNEAAYATLISALLSMMDPPLEQQQQQHPLLTADVAPLYIIGDSHILPGKHGAYQHQHDALVY